MPSSKVSSLQEMVSSNSSVYPKYRKKFWIGAQVRVGDYGLNIAWIARGGPSELAGLRVGDVIVAIEDTPMRTLDDMECLMFISSSKPAISVLVKNNQGTVQTHVVKQQEEILTYQHSTVSTISEQESASIKNHFVNVEVECDVLSCASTESRISSSCRHLPKSDKTQDQNTIGFANSDETGADNDRQKGNKSWLSCLTWSDQANTEGSSTESNECRSGICCQIADIFQSSNTCGRVNNLQTGKFNTGLGLDSDVLFRTDLYTSLEGSKIDGTPYQQTLEKLRTGNRQIRAESQNLCEDNSLIIESAQSDRTVFESMKTEEEDTTARIKSLEMKLRIQEADIEVLKLQNNSLKSDIANENLSRSNDVETLKTFLEYVSSEISWARESTFEAIQQLGEVKTQLEEHQSTRNNKPKYLETGRKNQSKESTSGQSICFSPDEFHKLQNTLADYKAALLLKEQQLLELSAQLQDIKSSESECLSTESGNQISSSRAEKELRRMKTAIQGNDNASKRREALLQNLKSENEILRERCKHCEQSKIADTLMEPQHLMDLQNILAELQLKFRKVVMPHPKNNNTEGKVGNQVEIQSLRDSILRLQNYSDNLKEEILVQLNTVNESLRYLIEQNENGIFPPLDLDDKISRLTIIASRSVSVTVARDQEMRAMLLKMISAERQVAEFKAQHPIHEKVGPAQTHLEIDQSSDPAELLQLLNSALDKLSKYTSGYKAQVNAAQESPIQYHSTKEVINSSRSHLNSDVSVDSVPCKDSIDDGKVYFI